MQIGTPRPPLLCLAAPVVLDGGYAVSGWRHCPGSPAATSSIGATCTRTVFRALNRLRRFAPATRSMLMDLRTLLDHRVHWSHEPAPVSDHLALLDAGEQACYQALLHGERGDRVRLKQERIRFSVVERAAEAAFALGPDSALTAERTPASPTVTPGSPSTGPHAARGPALC